MPFGDNVKTLALAEPWDWSRTRKPKTRRVKVPEVEAPWWWTEYLTDEWKRRNLYKQKPRDARTGLQKADDEWTMSKRRYALDDNPHTVGTPPHSIWD